jgi:hypothetical protein
MMMDARSIAQALGGIVQNGAALVPGPGHAPHDRSLRVYPDPDADNGFRVHSFAKDDPLHCRDYIAQKLGLPKWEPRRPHTNGHSYSNRHAKPNGNGAHHAAPIAAPAVIEAAAKVDAACADLPRRTAPDADGKPRFCQWGDGGPPPRDELRRHVYCRDGSPVRIKVKQASGGYVQWFRVRSGDGTGWQAKKPDGYVSVPYLGAIDPFDPELAGDSIHWPEGEKDCDTLGKISLPAFTFGGVGDGLPENAATFLAGRHVVILADNDEPGCKHAEAKAALATEAGAASVRVVHFPKLQPGGDVSDFLKGGGRRH